MTEVAPKRTPNLVRSMPRVTTIKSADPEQQLQNFIGKFEPKHQAVIRAVRKALRKRFPTATEVLDVETHRLPIDEVVADLYEHWLKAPPTQGSIITSST